MICPYCNRTISEEKRYLMSADPDQPGLGGLLRGEGSDPLLVIVARMAMWLAVFASAVCLAYLIAT